MSSGTRQSPYYAMCVLRGFSQHGELRVREYDCVDVSEESDQMCVFDWSFARMCAVISILEVNVHETVGLVAIEKTHSLTHSNQVVVEDGLKLSKRRNVELLVPSLVPARSLAPE